MTRKTNTNAMTATNEATLTTPDVMAQIVADAEALMDSLTQRKATNEPKGKNPCLCGCGNTPRGKKAKYLPGHDARHHAQLAKQIVGDKDALPTESNSALLAMRETCGTAWGECITATGSDCSCPCNGENHGAANRPASDTEDES